jgi:capsule assembly protein Wzi/PAP2 superfamily protein
VKPGVHRHVAALLLFALSFASLGSAQSQDNVAEVTGAAAAQNPAADVPKAPAPKSAGAQSTATQSEIRPASAAPVPFVLNVAYDQKQIWGAPFKARVQDLNWIVPIVGVTAGLINADAELSSRIDTTSTFAKDSGAISNGGVAIFLGGSAGLFLLGKYHDNPHQRETGILGIQAATNGLIVAQAIKWATWRQRPTVGTGQGLFFQSNAGVSSSFPSQHAIVAWSVASAFSHEYPGFFSQAFSYTLATGVSLARVWGKDHFPSDVFVGSVAGWLIGRQVYAAHHDPQLPGGSYGTFHRSNTEELPQAARFSRYVPMDSWVYPAMDRLGKMGLIHSDFLGLRPWTRTECARLLQEAQAGIDETGTDPAARLYNALANEFADEMQGGVRNNVSLDSLYTRAAGISGRPLTDDYHFARTIVNDYGRPYEEGFNALEGFSASGSSGAVGFYIRGEFQHAPPGVTLPQSVQNAINTADFKPLAPTLAVPAFNQFVLQDTYISLNIKGYQTSFGKQSLFLGPTMDPLLWNINAEPIYMLRFDQTAPKKLPSIFKYLGPYRWEIWAGKMSGQHYVNDETGDFFVRIGRTLPNQPMVNGFKINFKPTPNFEFGVGRTAMWGGPNFPITLETTEKSFFATNNAPGRGNDPGDRRSTFDFNWRLPGFRNLLTLYEDSFVEDEISPIGYPRRAAHNPGIYLTRLPGAPHMDLRVEGAYTNLPGLIQPPGGGFFYWNIRYLDGYTNRGHIIGNGAVGRQGIALRAQTTYWKTADKTISVGYRSLISDNSFIQGGNQRNFYLQSKWALKQNVELDSFAQYEYWNFPILSQGTKQTNFTISFQLIYRPRWSFTGGS